MLILCLKLTIHIDAIVVRKVAMTMGIKISVGSCAPLEARRAIIVIGITCKPEACRHKNMIWLLEAVDLSGLISWRLSIAFKAKGVAALSSPSRFAEKFITICPIAGCPFG